MPTEQKLQDFERCFQFRPVAAATRLDIIVERRKVFYFILMAISAFEAAEERGPEEYERLFRIAVEMWNLAGEFDRQPSFGA